MVSARARLIRDMVRIRTAEEILADYYRDEQEMRTPTHFSIGQEATAVGVCSATTTEDWVYSGHRSHAPYLAKGGDLEALVAELYGKEDGCAHGRGGSMHVMDQSVGFAGSAAILGEMISVAVGSGWTFARAGEERVALTFFGEGAADEGVFAESLNFAAVHRIPVVFVCENNLYSISSPLSVRHAEGTSVHGRAEAAGVRALSVDGNDVFAVQAAARDAVEHARRGEGPVLLELATYRWRAHVGPGLDHDHGYRSKEEIESWMAGCPIVRATDALRADEPDIDAAVATWSTEFQQETHAAVDRAKALPFPDTARLLDGAYLPETH
ncbi:thiamine pyrophosphate-dependent dehydrogenase E1 component subunit alpha [Streptomyces sp. ISL-100]|uniref:thiamine pyrophosphate-dependent dehydrogenase E1 component subunit alpha n=1 Tax=Streptomyces sp. ISL-100 TaxID=2819173 RepID=UPI001BE6DCAC|nr:thiamine pyrophosphate-dependent dehydrogenase E1 component subunit alpha [Streptomyces sp. ISL-100]MBT2399310.1 thiamine pyrophosphate-dependent dehydrogenase E1 component subunit alpha [Streptomyces sp. ISL-100]